MKIFYIRGDDKMGTLKEFYKTVKQSAVGWGWKKLDTQKVLVIAFFRMIWITCREFRDDMVTLRAASLTYITLVSIVPTLVFSFALANGIGATNKLIAIIQNNISDFPEGARIAINNIITTVQSVDYTKLGITGFLIAAYAAIKLLGKIEHSLNDIWGVKQHRTILRKFSDYISTVVMIPLLILASSSVTIMLSSESFISLIQNFFGPAAAAVRNLMSFSGLFIVVFAFFLLYIWMPNTRVKVLPALTGGIIGGVSWKIMLIFFVKFQTGLNDASVVYGTFAALPLFLVWLYSSWVIVLFGSEVVFSVQHWRTFDLDMQEKEISFSSAVSLSLIIMQDVLASYREGKPWNPDTFSDSGMLSVRQVLTISDLLAKNGILEYNSEPVPHFLPARMPEMISIGDIVRAISGEKSDQINSIEPSRKELALINDQQWQDYLHEISAKNIVMP